MPRRTTDNPQAARRAPTASDDSEETNFEIVTPETWDMSKLRCGQLKDNKSGQGKSGSLTYNGKKFYLKTPKMYCPFGATFPKAQDGTAPSENPKWSLQMAFNSNDTASQNFQSKVEEFDQYMVDEAGKPENQVTWLGASKTKLFPAVVVESKYKPMRKVPLDKTTKEPSTQYPPFIRPNFMQTFQEPIAFSTEFYDRDSKPITVSTDVNSPNAINKKVPSQCSASGLLQGSIWANSNGFGVTWSVAQIKVFPSKALPKGKCLLGDPEDEESEATDNVVDETTTSQEQNQPESEETNQDGDGVQVVPVDDETEQPVDVQEVEAEVEVAPAPVVAPVVNQPKTRAATASAPKLMTKPKAK